MLQWYFAYGSNMLTEQMIARTGHPGPTDPPPRMGHLPDYCLVFNLPDADGTFYANLKQPGPGVFGVLYRCSSEVLNKLDVFESGYDRHNVRVVDHAYIEHNAVTYIARPENIYPAGSPSARYLHKIIVGARDHNLPEAYIQNIVTCSPNSAP